MTEFGEGITAIEKAQALFREQKIKPTPEEAFKEIARIYEMIPSRGMPSMKLSYLNSPQANSQEDPANIFFGNAPLALKYVEKSDMPDEIRNLWIKSLKEASTPDANRPDAKLPPRPQISERSVVQTITPVSEQETNPHANPPNLFGAIQNVLSSLAKSISSFFSSTTKNEGSLSQKVE